MWSCHVSARFASWSRCSWSAQARLYILQTSIVQAMEMFLGHVLASEAVYLEDPQIENASWGHAKVPGCGFPGGPQGRFHVLAPCFSPESLFAAEKSEWWRLMQRSSTLATAAAFQVTCVARTPVRWNPNVVLPTHASLLKHVFRPDTWTQFTSTETETAGEPHEFDLILAMKEAIFQALERSSPDQRLHDWILVVFPDSAAPQMKGDDLGEVFKAVQDVTRATESVPMLVLLSSHCPQLTEAGGMYASSTSFKGLNMTTWADACEKDTAFQLVRQAFSESTPEVFSSAAMLMHPQLAKTLSVMPIGHTSMNSWIREGIAWCQRKLDAHLEVDVRNLQGHVECCVTGVVPVPFTGASFSKVVIGWSTHIL